MGGKIRKYNIERRHRIKRQACEKTSIFAIVFICRGMRCGSGLYCREKPGKIIPAMLPMLEK